MVEVAAVHGRANASLMAGYGYTGILVAFMARHNPLGIIPVALLLGGIGASGGLLQRDSTCPTRPSMSSRDPVHRHPRQRNAVRRDSQSAAARRVADKADAAWVMA